MTMAMDSGGSGAGGRERLLAAALDLFLEAGYEGVSMQQIADAAAMTKGAPYHHFSSKEDLFGQALGRHFDRIQEGLHVRMEAHADLRERMIEGFVYLIEHSDAGMVRLVEDLRRLVGVERMAGYGVTLDRLRECNRSLFEQAESTSVPLACTAAEAADLFLAVQVGELSLLEIETRFEISPEIVRARARWIVDIMLSGLVSDRIGAGTVKAAGAEQGRSERDRERSERC